MRSEAKCAAGAEIVEESALARLISLGARRGIDSNSVREMHRLIGFSDPAVGYIRRLRRIREIARLKIGKENFADGYPQVTSWMPYIDEVLSAPGEFADAAGLSEAEKRGFLAESQRDPLCRRGIKHHPLEALLWIVAPYPVSEGARRLLMLQGQMMVAQISILDVGYAAAEDRGDASPGEELFKYLYSPCLLAQGLAQKEWSRALPCLPFLKDAAEYAKALDGLRRESARSVNSALNQLPAHALDKAFVAISRFILRGVEQKAYQKRIFNGRKSSKTVGGHPPLQPESVTGLDGQDDGGNSEITRMFGTAAKRKQLDQNGEAAEDHLRCKTFLLTEGGKLTIEHILAVRARQNQSLPRGYREPQPRECALLLEQMRAHTEPFDSGTKATELIAWTQVILFQSCSPKQATELLVGYETTPLVDCDFFLRFAENPENDSLFPPRVRVRAIAPSYKTVNVPIDGERPQVEYFEIPDLGSLSISIRELLHDLKGVRTDCSFEAVRMRALKIFTQDAGTYTDLVNRFAVLIGIGDRVQVSGLGKVLFQRYVENDDIVSAALITCSEPHLAAVRRWYYTPAVSMLRQVHQRGKQKSSAEFPKMFPDLHSAPLETSTEFVGSRRCAEFDYIKQLVCVLQNIVLESCAVRSAQQRREVFASKHNALMILAFWFGPATAVKFGPLGRHWLGFMDGATEA